MLTPREKSPLPENVPRGGSNPRRCGQRAEALPTELFRKDLMRESCKTLSFSSRSEKKKEEDEQQKKSS